MGAKPSTPGRAYDDDDDHDDAKCHQCFFLRSPSLSHHKSTTPSMDWIGSPQPETPMHERRKRAEVAKQTSSWSSSSSKYHPPQGLEQEVIQEESTFTGGVRSTTTTTTTTTTKGNRDNIVHDGPDAEKELHQKYQLMEVLGIGSTSNVHRCLNKKDDLFYACKIIDKEQMEDRFQGMMAQFQTEVEALRDLQHPSIIQLMDVYLTRDRIYIIMELMEGGELFDYVVQKGTLNEEEASKIVHRVTSAMVYMHNKNIVHRDLKPENLLLKRKPKPTEDIEVKIIDFGLSKAMEEPVARTFLGTRGYLAPEMLQRREYTKAVDTWALGVIIFVLLCGCLPFDDDSQTVPSDDLIKSKFVLRFPRWASNLSDSAKDLLSKLLNTDYKARYTAEQALQHPWVKGKTAPKKNLLASPGRIKNSPYLRSPHRKTAAKSNAATAANANRRYRKPDAAPDATPPQVTRKQSL